MDSAGIGLMAGGTVLPSIHKLSHMLGVAPGTVGRAYQELRAPGIFTSRTGKGYFVTPDNVQLNQRVFVLFDSMNACKEILFDSFMEVVGQTSAEMVPGETKGIIPNPFSLIVKSSLMESSLQDIF